jgi:hypothetical protein
MPRHLFGAVMNAKHATSSRPGTYDPNWHLPKRNDEDDESPQILGSRVVTAADLGQLTALYTQDNR